MLPTLLALLFLEPGACVPVSGEKIYARDLAEVPEAAALPPEQFLGYAPAPGLRRLMPIGTARTTVCVEWTMRVPAKDEFERAIRVPAGVVEVLDYSRYPVPPGEISFPPQGIVRQKDGLLWRGKVTYAPNRNFPVWAKVRITRTGSFVVANQPLRAGVPITAEQLREQATADAMPADPVPAGMDEVIGKIAKRWIPAGTLLVASMLTSAPEVARGQVIEVESRSGSVRFKMSGKAETGGRRGDTISVRNLESGKSFRARVLSPGKAVVGEEGSK